MALFNIADLRLLLMNRLTNSTSLVAIVTQDPVQPSSPAIFHARMQELSPVYPCVTYRIAQATPDPRTRVHPTATPDADGEASQLSCRVTEYAVDFEAWDNKPNSDALDAICMALFDLFDNRSFYMEEANVRVFHSAVTYYNPDGYHPDLNARFSLMRIVFRTSRSD